jgi:transcriptional regulator with XRE-family HTH domain
VSPVTPPVFDYPPVTPEVTPTPEREGAANEGARLLRASGASLAAIAKAANRSKPAAVAWRSGKALPDAESRAALAIAFAIPPAAWELASSAEAAQPEPPSSAMAAPAGSTAAQVDALLSSVRADRAGPGVSAAQRAKLASLEGTLLGLKARLEADAREAEDRLSESPAFQRFQATLRAALQPYPDAARAVVAALEAVDA